jgi:hypothetical protein
MLSWEFLYKNSNKKTSEVGERFTQDVHLVKSLLLFSRCALTGLQKFSFLGRKTFGSGTSFPGGTLLLISP